MDTNLVFNAIGAVDGMTSILYGFSDTLSDYFGDFTSELVVVFGFLVVIVGIWYGLKAILRAVRSVR